MKPNIIFFLFVFCATVTRPGAIHFINDGTTMLFLTDGLHWGKFLAPKQSCDVDLTEINSLFFYEESIGDFWLTYRLKFVGSKSENATLYFINYFDICCKRLDFLYQGTFLITSQSQLVVELTQERLLASRNDSVFVNNFQEIPVEKQMQGVIENKIRQARDDFSRKGESRKQPYQGALADIVAQVSAMQNKSKKLLE